jgi:hypothetical protein
MFDHAKKVNKPPREETLQSYDDSYESSRSSDYGAFGSVNGHDETNYFDDARIGAINSELENELTTMEVGGMLEFVPCMYDPSCFEIICPSLLAMLGNIPDPEMERIITIDYIEVAMKYGKLWTDLIRYDPPVLQEAVVDIEDYEFIDVELQHPNNTSGAVLGCFNEVVVEIDTTDLFDFADDASFKRISIPVQYDVLAVCDIVLGHDMQVVVDVEARDLVFFPLWSKIPANFQAIERSLKSGQLPPDLQRYLIGLSLEGKISFQFGDFFVPPSDTVAPELLPEPSGGIFSGARLDIPKPPKPTSVQNRRGRPREGGKDSSQGLRGFQKFKKDVENLQIEFDPDDYILESEDLNELMAEEPTAMAVNGVLTKSRITSMSAKVTRYFQKTGKFYLTGEERYLNMFKLLLVSGAFASLNRKLEEPYSFVVAMKVWLFRTAIVEAPCHSTLEFITI